MQVQRYSQKEKIMNKLFKPLSFVVLIMLVATACGARVVEAKHVEQPVSIAPNYQSLVGKSVGDKNVVDFIASNYCSSSYQYQLCEASGIALGINLDQTVKTVILFPGGTHEIARFHGGLPRNLNWNDSMASVNQKLGAPDATFQEQGELPHDRGTPDEIRLWASYKELGLTIVYNSLSAKDNNAAIYAILITK